MDKGRRVVLDVDGVLADFEKSFCEKFGWENHHLVNLHERYPDKFDEIDLFVSLSSTYEKLDIIPLGVRIAQWFNQQKFDIFVVSSRPEYTVQATGLWLKRNKIPFHFLEVGVKNKVDSVMRIKPLVAVDDLLSVAQDYVRYDVPSILMDQPWNQCENLPILAKRAHNFDEFVKIMVKWIEIF